MDKKPKKNQSKTPRKTFSLDDESLGIIKDEQKLGKETNGYEPKESAVIRLALQMLKEHRERAKAKSAKLEDSGRADLKKASDEIKSGAKKA